MCRVKTAGEGFRQDRDWGRSGRFRRGEEERVPWVSEGQRKHDVHEGAMRQAGQQRDWTSGTEQGGQAQALGPGQAV